MKLNDVCELIVDCPHSTAANEGKGYPLIRTPNIGKGRLELKNVHRVSEKVYNDRNKRAVPREGDIILAREAPVGNVAMITKGQKVCLGQRTVLIRANQTVVDPEYLTFYLLSPKIQNELLGASNGATVSHLNMSAIRNLKIALPDLILQNKIGAVLRVLSDKIEVNDKINENLLEQIQAIYWDEYNPDAHEADGLLSDICKYSSDKIQVDNLSVSTYISTENMLPEKRGSVDASSLPSVSQTTKCHKGDVLISNIRPYFKKILYVSDECGCSTDVLCFTPKESIYSAYLFGTLYGDRFFDYMVAGSKGTKMPRGDKQQIMAYPILIPEIKSLISYNQIVMPMLETIASNRIEISRLVSLRDTLLPKLMSGELDVFNLDL